MRKKSFDRLAWMKVVTALASPLNFTTFEISTPSQQKQPICPVVLLQVTTLHKRSRIMTSSFVSSSRLRLCQWCREPWKAKLGVSGMKWELSKFVHGNCVAPRALLMYNSKGNKEVWAPTALCTCSCIPKACFASMLLHQRPGADERLETCTTRWSAKETPGPGMQESSWNSEKFRLNELDKIEQIIYRLINMLLTIS